MPHYEDSEWQDAKKELPDLETVECSCDVIVYEQKTGNYHIGFYAYPSKQWVESNTNNHLYSVSRWRYFKKP